MLGFWKFDATKPRPGMYAYSSLIRSMYRYGASYPAERLAADLFSQYIAPLGMDDAELSAATASVQNTGVVGQVVRMAVLAHPEQILFAVTGLVGGWDWVKYITTLQRGDVISPGLTGLVNEYVNLVHGQLVAAINTILSGYDASVPVVCVGHSFGGNVAHVLGSRIKVFRPATPVTIHCIGSPRFANQAYFSQAVSVFNWCNTGDPVVNLPPTPNWIARYGNSMIRGRFPWPTPVHDYVITPGLRIIISEDGLMSSRVPYNDPDGGQLTPYDSAGIDLDAVTRIATETSGNWINHDIEEYQRRFRRLFQTRTTLQAMRQVDGRTNFQNAADGLSWSIPTFVQDRWEAPVIGADNPPLQLLRPISGGQDPEVNFELPRPIGPYTQVPTNPLDLQIPVAGPTNIDANPPGSSPRPYLPFPGGNTTVSPANWSPVFRSKGKCCSK